MIETANVRHRIREFCAGLRRLLAAGTVRARPRARSRPGACPRLKFSMFNLRGSPHSFISRRLRARACAVGRAIIAVALRRQLHFAHISCFAGPGWCRAPWFDPRAGLAGMCAGIGGVCASFLTVCLLPRVNRFYSQRRRILCPRVQ